MRREPAAVAGEDDLVEVREAVVAELEGPQLDPALLGLDALPGRERDDEVGALGVEGLVGRGVEGHGRERPLAAVGLDDRLQRGLLVRVAEPGVRLAIELARPGDRRRVEDRDLLRGVLEDGHHRHDRGAAGRREGQRVLEADAALGLAGRHQRLGRGRAVRQDLEVDAGVGVPAVRLRDVDPRVVRVRRPVEREADRAERRRRRRGDGDGRGRRASTVPATAPRSKARPTRPAPLHPATTRIATSRRAHRNRWKDRMSVDIRSPSSMENAVTSDSGDGVNESTGLLPSPVLAGSGSAGLWRSPHSQRTRRSPEAVFGCGAMVHRPSGPLVRADRLMTCATVGAHARYVSITCPHASQEVVR